jgi:internalin A
VAEPAGGAPEGGVAGASEAGEGGVGGEPAPSCDPIVFDDPDFEYAVRASVNKPTGAITSADVAGLTFVAASGVKSIRGAECLTDLTDFDIGGLPWGDVTDLSPLAPLKKLETIDVGHNPLASVAPLGDLPKLKQLFMSNVPTQLDLSPLAGAPALELVYLEKDTLVDLAPLGTVKTLVTLDLRQATVLLPAGAAKLKSVVDLNALGVFDDVTPLAALTHLQKLHIGLKPTQGFAALATLKDLIYLDAQHASIADLAPLAGMTKLQQVSVADNQVSDLTPLQGLTLLREVVLVGNQVQDLSPLVKNASFAKGASLYVQKNPYDCAAQAANVSDLQGRGVEVFSDCQ